MLWELAPSDQLEEAKEPSALVDDIFGRISMAVLGPVLRLYFSLIVRDQKNMNCFRSQNLNEH